MGNSRTRSNRKFLLTHAWLRWLSLFVLLSAVGCSPPNETLNPDGNAVQRRHLNQSENVTMQLTSTAFDNRAAIPAKFTGVSEDVSPPLAWSKAAGAKSYALICDDPDAPSRANPRPEGPWVHWVIYNIPADMTELPAAVARQAAPPRPAGARQGRNDFASDNVGYRGPMPPNGSGPHRYFFRIYALDRQLDLDPKEADKRSLLAAIQGHILAEGELIGTFERE